MLDTSIRSCSSEKLTIDLPPKCRARLARFLSEGETGNVQLQVKDGKILGIKVEEIIR